MTTRDIITQLVNSGHRVSFYHRKDGGFVITKIDGVSYTGKTGNAVARKMLGQKLSQARVIQLERIRTPKGKRALKQEAVPEELKKKLRKIQKEWRKTHPDIRGTMSIRGLRYKVKYEGYQEALMSLDKGWRKTQGLAYTENVDYLIQRIRQDNYKLNSPAMERVIEIIEAKKEFFKEEWIFHCYEEVYKWERGLIDGDECARIILATIE